MWVYWLHVTVCIILYSLANSNTYYGYWLVHLHRFPLKLSLSDARKLCKFDNSQIFTWFFSAGFGFILASFLYCALFFGFLSKKFDFLALTKYFYNWLIVFNVSNVVFFVFITFTYINKRNQFTFQRTMI